MQGRNPEIVIDHAHPQHGTMYDASAYRQDFPPMWAFKAVKNQHMPVTTWYKSSTGGRLATRMGPTTGKARPQLSIDLEISLLRIFWWQETVLGSEFGTALL